MKRAVGLVIMMLGMALCLAGFSVKVVAVDHKRGEIRVLLPMHQVELMAEQMPQEPEIRVRVREFYEATFEPGVVGTTKPNVLRIEIPGEKPARYRLRTVKILN
jgi:hypothetical protein